MREAADDILKKENPYQLTLADVHRQVFEDILSMETLEQLKLFYKEEGIFNNVKSSSDSSVEDSFLANVKKGKVKNFNPNNDTALDLIKLLYARAFSFTDLKKHTNGESVYPAAVKLDIPRLNPHYAHILKLSDRKSNERIVKAIVENRMEARELRLQSGEPVFIPRKQMTKPEISYVNEDLNRHFEENPETIYGQTENQKRFYEQHPEMAERFSNLIYKTWSISHSMMSKVQKHFKSAGKKIEIKDLDPFKITPENVEILKDFWTKNPWAIKKFSETMEIARKSLSADYDKCHTIKMAPEGFLADFEKWKAKNNITEETPYNTVLNEDGSFRDADSIMKTQKLITEFCDENLVFKDTMADVYSVTALELTEHIEKNHHKLESPKREILINLANMIRSNISEISGQERIDPETGEDCGKYITTDEAGSIYQDVLLFFIEFGYKNELSFLYEKMDANYLKFKKLHMARANSDS